jgi:hypothetical protein
MSRKDSIKVSYICYDPLVGASQFMRIDVTLSDKKKKPAVFGVTRRHTAPKFHAASSVSGSRKRNDASRTRKHPRLRHCKHSMCIIRKSHAIVVWKPFSDCLTKTPVTHVPRTASRNQAHFQPPPQNQSHSRRREGNGV